MRSIILHGTRVRRGADGGRDVHWRCPTASIPCRRRRCRATIRPWPCSSRAWAAGNAECHLCRPPARERAVVDGGREARCPRCRCCSCRSGPSVASAQQDVDTSTASRRRRRRSGCRSCRRGSRRPGSRPSCASRARRVEGGCASRHTKASTPCRPCPCPRCCRATGRVL
jgi:hypothetical protein